MKIKKGAHAACKKSNGLFIFSASLGLAVLLFWGTCKSSPGVKGIFAGVANVFIIADDGSLWSAGYNRSGQLGFENNGGQDMPAGIFQIKQNGKGFTGVKSVAAGENHTVIVKDDGTLWAVGESLYGELGLGGDGSAKLSGLTRLEMTGVRYAAAGNNSTFVIKDDGTLWAAGYNFYGELGLGNRENMAAFTQVTGAGKDVKAVAAGARHTVILKNDGTVWAAGYNFNGQLGLGNTEDTVQFTQVRSIGAGSSAVAAGNYHTVILKSDGTVWSAGENFYGQLGWSDAADRNQFAQVQDDKGQAINNAKDIAARGNLTLVHKKDNALLLAGSFADPVPRDENNLPPEKQGGDSKSSFVPLEAEKDNTAALKDIKKVVLGNQSIYVIAGKNQLLAAGSNRYGQLNQSYDTDTIVKLKSIYP
ncbi:MAG: hypothetical protein LBH43_07010 [Treponema sp.]|jgi:alpha-tubulin suppressor-like RCC1 family protein|nr:hypothetical protein [Treponema sp.]